MWEEAGVGMEATAPNPGIGDGECGKAIWVIGTLADGGDGAGWEACGAAAGCCGGGGAGRDCGSEGDTDADAEESAVPAAISVITGEEVAGRVGMPPYPGKPNCGNAGRPSRAESRAP